MQPVALVADNSLLSRIHPQTPGSVAYYLQTPVQVVSERVNGPLEHSEKENSPRGAPDPPDKPGSELAAPGDRHRYREHPRSHANNGVEETNALRRDREPGGWMNDWAKSDGVEGNPDRGKIVEGAEYDGIGPSSHKNERVDETNAPCPDRAPGGRLAEGAKLGDVEVNPNHENVIDSTRYDGTGPRSNGIARIVETSASNPFTGPAGHRGDRAEFRGIEDRRTHQIDGESVGDYGRRDESVVTRRSRYGRGLRWHAVVIAKWEKTRGRACCRRRVVA